MNLSQEAQAAKSRKRAQKQRRTSVVECFLLLLQYLHVAIFVTVTNFRPNFVARALCLHLLWLQHFMKMLSFSQMIKIGLVRHPALTRKPRYPTFLLHRTQGQVQI